MFGKMQPMRKLTEPQAHRGRVAVIDGNFPEGMRARCAWCRRIEPIIEGEMVSAHTGGNGATRMFKCSGCLTEENEGAA
jgi:hypothetical protein